MCIHYWLRLWTQMFTLLMLCCYIIYKEVPFFHLHLKCLEKDCGGFIVTALPFERQCSCSFRQNAKVHLRKQQRGSHQPPTFFNSSSINWLFCISHSENTFKGGIIKDAEDIKKHATAILNAVLWQTQHFSRHCRHTCSYRTNTFLPIADVPVLTD
jgi:hypothetical protein